MKILRTILAAVFCLGVGLAPATSSAGDSDVKLWKKCATCHGKTGAADTKMAKKMKVADMTTAEWQKRFSDQEIKDVTVKGLKRVVDGTKQKMKPYKKFTPEELDALVKLIRSWAK